MSSSSRFVEMLPPVITITTTPNSGIEHDIFADEDKNKLAPTISGRDDLSAPTLDSGTGAPLEPSTASWKAREKALVKKIDLQLMPILIVIYILHYMDRTSNIAARDNGLQTTLSLSDSQYATALSTFWACYILLQVPSNILLTKLGRPSVYLPCFVALWGVVSGCTAATQNYRDLLMVRLVLGVCESTFFPGAVCLMNLNYKKAEVTTRLAVFFSGMALSNAFSGLIAAAIIGEMEGKAGIQAWRWLFIIEGGITVVVALVAVFVLPDMPYNSRFLTEEERKMAVTRLAIDPGSNAEKQVEEASAWEGFVMALGDAKIWVLAIAALSYVVGNGFLQYMPTLMRSLGYSPVHTLLLLAPIWTFAFIFCLFTALHSDRVQERTVHIIIPLFLGIVGCIIAATSMNHAAWFISFFIQAASVTGFILILSWIGPSFPGPKYKRAISVALINSVAQSGSIVASYLWPTRWGPSYGKSYTNSAAMFALCIAAVLVHRWVLQRENANLEMIEVQIENQVEMREKERGEVEVESGRRQTSRREKERDMKMMLAESGFRYML